MALGLIRRNFAGYARIGWKQTYAVAKAMRRYLAAHTACEWCGRPASVVHHPQPVHISPDTADDPENMVAACAKCHLRVWHAGDWRRWVSGLRFAVQQGTVKVNK